MQSRVRCLWVVCMEVWSEGSHLSLAPLFPRPAPSPQHRILLDFLFLDTECTYDYLFVYDGDSPRGPLLASLSGSTRPPPIEASSGKVGGAGPWAVAGGSQCSVGQVGRCTQGGTERHGRDMASGRRTQGQRKVERDKERRWGLPGGSGPPPGQVPEPCPLVPTDAAAPL